jgi:cyclohexa-1,5-dienecarbonyl-CoA hydratase
MIRDLGRALSAVPGSPAVKLVTIEGAGDHFSYGASVEEHRPAVVGDMLREFHRLILGLLAVPAPTAALVRGRCLGGGFEIALACDFIFAATNAVLGVPEIGLGVFPPAAAALLPVRVGVSRAAHAVITGEMAAVDHWFSSGLIEAVALPQELEARVDAWFTKHLETRSAAALRCAVAASRSLTRRHVAEVLPELETLYLDTLMRTRDATEGIAAFLDKRPPAWSDA